MPSAADITLVSSFHSGEPPSSSESSFPLGCAYLLAVLKRHNYEVDFRDYQFCAAPDPLNATTFATFLADSAPIIGISSVSSMLPTVLLACQFLKQEHPEKAIILGGPGPSSAPRQILQNYPAVDVIVIGEGEQTLAELLFFVEFGDKSQLSRVKGLAFRQGEQIVLTPPRPRLQDLDQLPLITEVLDLLPPLEKYDQVHLMMSRGCTYRCSFCGVAPFWGRKNASRSQNHVLQEVIELLDNHQVPRIVFSDDLFTLVRARVESFCHEIRKRSLEMRWGCHGRINLVDGKLMETMAAAGCDAIFYGVESGADRIIQQVKTGFSVSQAIQVLHESLQYFPIVKPSFIWGFPFESMSEFEQTLLLMVYARELGCISRVSMLIPEPLSTLYEQNKYELALDFSLIHHGVLGAEVVDQFSAEMRQAIEDYPDLYCSFYHFPHPSLGKKIAMMDRVGEVWMPRALNDRLDAVPLRTGGGGGTSGYSERDLIYEA